MLQFLQTAHHWLTGTRLVRRLLDAVFRNRARREVVELDQLSVARSQKRTLLGLVHQAQGTRFGRDHDFRRIRTLDDFRRLVPLQTPARLWHDYWQPALPRLAGTTWPGPLTNTSFGPEHTAVDRLRYVPVSAGLRTAHQNALRTALGLMAHSHFDRSPFTGPLCYVGGGSGPSWNGAVAATAWEDVYGQEIVAGLRTPAVLAPAGGNGTDKLTLLARRSVRQPVHGLVGSVERLTRFAAVVRQQTGHDRLRDVWPTLSAVLCLRGTSLIDRHGLAEAFGAAGVRVLQGYLPPEGPVATEDPRYGKLRLLPDHGVFFEFVPTDQLGRPRPTRWEAAQVEPGIPCALALTSPAGVWACLTGAEVCFESRDPPLLRLLALPENVENKARSAACPDSALGPAPSSHSDKAAAHPFPVQPPHHRNGQSPAGLVPHTPGRSGAKRVDSDADNHLP